MINFVQRKRENEQQRAEKKSNLLGAFARITADSTWPDPCPAVNKLLFAFRNSRWLLSPTQPREHLSKRGQQRNVGLKKKTIRPYRLIFFSYKGPLLWPTSLQNQYSSRISAKAEPCALIHASFVPQHLPPVSSRQIVSGNDDDGGDEEAAVCLHIRGRDRCPRQAQRDNWEEAVPLVRWRRTSWYFSSQLNSGDMNLCARPPPRAQYCGEHLIRPQWR